MTGVLIKSCYDDFVVYFENFLFVCVKKAFIRGEKPSGISGSFSLKLRFKFLCRAVNVLSSFSGQCHILTFHYTVWKESNHFILLNLFISSTLVPDSLL